MRGGGGSSRRRTRMVGLSSGWGPGIQTLLAAARGSSGNLARSTALKGMADWKGVLRGRPS